MYRSCMVVCIAFLLSGCTTFEQMHNGLQMLKGRNIKVAFDVLGKPSYKKIEHDETIYTWSASESSVFVSSQGVSGKAALNHYQIAIEKHHCVIHLLADSFDDIIGWRYRGDLGGCKKYIDRLQDYSKRLNPS